MFSKNFFTNLNQFRPKNSNFSCKNLFHTRKSIRYQANDNVNKTIEITTKNKRWPKILLYTTVLPGSAFFAYYQFVLSPQEQRKVRVNIQSIGRAARSFGVGLKIAVDYKWNLFGLDEDGEEYTKNIKECHLRSAKLMVKACIQNGGLYVKLGQGLSTMNHILPKEYYHTLRSLQTEALRSEGNDIDALFKEEFGKLPNEIFQEFDYKPLAAASLAQVHKAIDKNGNEIAVKLQYIDLQDRFAGDIFTCKSILKMIGFAFKDFNFSWVLDELKDTLAKELDFVNEANNSKRCYNELKHLKYVYVPKVYDSLTTKVDEKLVNLFAEQIFHTGFVHADPHHGNIYVRKLAGTKNKAEIVLLDHGLYDTVNENDRKNICKLWKYIILKDEPKMKFYSSKLNVDAFIAMKPLHRPIHDKFIFNSDWLRMSDKERQKATQEGKFRLPTPSEFRKMKRDEINEWRNKFKPYLEELKEDILTVFRQFPRGLLLASRFCDMLTMEPPLSRVSGLTFKKNLHESDILRMRETIRSQFDKIHIILKQLETYMLLVFRNLNTVRSIIHDHGNLIDRHTLMARSAIYGSYKEELKLGFKLKVKAWFELKMFDLILWYDSLKRWTSTKYLNLMVKLGQIEREVVNEISKSMDSHDYYE